MPSLDAFATDSRWQGQRDSDYLLFHYRTWTISDYPRSNQRAHSSWTLNRMIADKCVADSRVLQEIIRQHLYWLEDYRVFFSPRRTSSWYRTSDIHPTLINSLALISSSPMEHIWYDWGCLAWARNSNLRSHLPFMPYIILNGFHVQER